MSRISNWTVAHEFMTVQTSDSTMFILWLPDVATILVFVVVFLLGYWLMNTNFKNLPPGPRPLPLVGNIMELPKAKKMGMNNYMKSLAGSYGPVTRLWVGRKLVVILHSLDMIKEALVDKKDVFSNRPMSPDSVPDKREGKGIIRANEKSKEIRRHTLVCMRDFGLGKKSLEARIQTEAGYLVTALWQHEGKPIDMKRLLANAVSNIVCHLTLGTRYEYSDPVFGKQLEKIQYAVANKQPIMHPFHFLPFLRYFRSAKITHEFMDVFAFLMASLQEHKKSFDPENIRDLIDVFLQGQKEHHDVGIFDESNLRASMLDLFGAGTETTSSTLSWAILYLLKHPEIQTKCQEDIDRVIGCIRVPSLSDRAHLPYIIAVLQEVQRIATVVPYALPHVTSADSTLGPYFIPKNTMVIANLYAVHRDPAHWDDPDAFKPERWLNDEGKLIKNDAYIPFGVGPRICLGEALANRELFLFFTRMLQHLTFQKETPDTELSFEEIIGISCIPIPYKVCAIER